MIVKITVRTLTLFIVLFVGVLLISYMLAPTWFMRAKAYSIVACLYPWSRVAPEALMLSAEQADPSAGPNLVYIFPGDGLSSSGTTVSRAQADKAKRYLNRLIERYPNSVYATNARLLREAIDEQLGNWGQAIQALRKQANASPDWNQSEAKKRLQRLFATENSKQNPQVLGKVTVNGKPVSHAYVFLRSTREANMFYSDAIVHYMGAFTDNTGTYRISRVTPGSYQICVGVTPRQVAGYFLPLPQSESIHVSKTQALTYNLKFVPRIKLTNPTGGDTMSGKSIRFTWQPYPGAAYYKLSLTDFLDLNPTNFDSITLDLKGRYHSHHATFTIDALRHILPGPSYSYLNGSSTSAVLAPSSVLGLLYPGGEFSWDVNAYDAKGNLLSSSRSVYLGLPDTTLPIFYTSSEGELQGDKLLLKGQQTKAIAAHTRDVPNPYALRALAALALYGSEPHTHGVSEGNPKLALDYLKQLPNRTPDVQQLIIAARKQLAHIDTSSRG